LHPIINIFAIFCVTERGTYSMYIMSTKALSWHVEKKMNPMVIFVILIIKLSW